MTGAVYPNKRPYPFSDGKTSFPVNLLPLAAFQGAIVLAFFALNSRHYETTAPARPDNLILITFLWVLNFYNNIGIQVKMRLDYNNHGAVATNTATRVAMNQLEQAPAFLTSLWICGIYFDYGVATNMGYFYVVYRFLYTLTYTAFGHFTIACEFCTQPNYMAIFYMILKVMEAIFNFEITNYFADNYYYHFASHVALGLVLFVLNFTLLWNVPVGYIGAKWNNDANPVAKNPVTKKTTTKKKN